MKFFACVTTLVAVGVAGGWRPLALESAPSAPAACCPAECCTSTDAGCTCCTTPVGTAACTAACCATPAKASVNAPACCAMPAKASVNAPACGASPVKTSVAAPACFSASPRKASAGRPVELVPIEGSLQPVIDRFNADQDKPRIVALLSPTCGGCVHAANAIYAEAVEAYPDEDLSVLVIWEPMLGSDNEAAARETARIFDDPRVHQFWDADRLSGIAYSTEVFPQRLQQIAHAMPADHFMKERFKGLADRSPEAVPMWDFALFYPAGVRWTDTPPASDAFIRQLAIYKTPDGMSATILTDDFTKAPVQSDWYDEVRREMTTLLASAPAPRRSASRQYPDSPTGRAAQALVELTWTTGDDALADFVENRLSPGSHDRNPGRELLDAFAQIRELLTDAELRVAEKTGPLTAELVLASTRTGTQMTISIELEPEPPHRIDHLEARIGGEGGDAASPVCEPPADAANVNALGVATTVPASDVATAMNLTRRVRTEGRLVTEVQANSPADVAGIATGDVILQLGGNRLYSADDITDFLAITAPGDPVDVLVRRAGTTQDELVRITPLSSPPSAGDRSRINWQFAGLGQLDEAMSVVKATGRPLLVGLTGSDTCCPFTRFEIDSLSAIVDDPRVVEGSRDFVSIIIRRPHAYWFLQDIGSNGRMSLSVRGTPDGLYINDDDLLPIPSLFFLDADRTVLGNVALAEPAARDKVLDHMEKLASR